MSFTPKAAAVFALLSLCAVVPQTQTSPAAASELIPVQSRQPAPDFTLTDLQGKEFTLSRYKGRVVLLDFWATTCGGCKVELPWYVAFYSKYHSEGLAVIGLDMYGETPEVIKPFVQKWKMDYPVAVGTDAIGDHFHLRELPLTVLIDRKGNIAISHAGIVNQNAFEHDIQQLLQQ